MIHVADKLAVIRKKHETEPDEPHPLAARLEYGAVPLNGWSARDYDTPDEWYTIASLDRLRAKAAEAVKNAVDRHQWAQPEVATNVQDIIERSIVDSHLQRIDRNVTFVEQLGEQDDRFERAQKGLADPAELLTMLLDHPELGSIELAKLSHPLDSAATYPMDVAVSKVLRALNAVAVQPAHFRAKTVDDTIPAITVLRKQEVGRIDDVVIVRRQAFLVRGDQEAKDELGDPYFDRKLRDACPGKQRREQEVYPMIEDFLPGLPMLPELKWLQPIATSYYAKNITTVMNPREGTKAVTRYGE